MEGALGGRRRFGGRGRCDFALESDFHDRRLIIGGQNVFQLIQQRERQVDVVDCAGGLVVKMGMRPKIRAVAGGAALVIYLADQLALNERFQTVVDRRERNGWHLGFDAGEDLFGGGMIALLEQRRIHKLTLRGSAQAAISELLRETVGHESVLFDHVGESGNKLEWF